MSRALDVLDLQPLKAYAVTTMRWDEPITKTVYAATRDAAPRAAWYRETARVGGAADPLDAVVSGCESRCPSPLTAAPAGGAR